MPKPAYKYKIRFIDYDGEYIDGVLHGSGGPLLVLLEKDGNEWVEVDQWSEELIRQRLTMSNLSDLEIECINWRHFAWVICPHEGKYGDDGEMQCHGTDFKQENFTQLSQHVIQALQKYANKQ